MPLLTLRFSLITLFADIAITLILPHAIDIYAIARHYAITSFSPLRQIFSPISMPLYYAITPRFHVIRRYARLTTN